MIMVKNPMLKGASDDTETMIMVNNPMLKRARDDTETMIMVNNPMLKRARDDTETERRRRAESDLEKRRRVELEIERRIERRRRVESVREVRKVRIVYADPDATDSDSESDEFDRNQTCGVSRMKRVVREVVLSSNLDNLDNGSAIVCTDIDQLKSNRRSSSMFKGVRKRPWGKFSSEIRNPFTKKRMWLGTFESEEIAAKAYQEKKKKFEELLQLEKNIRSERRVPSPSSVLEVGDSLPTDRAVLVGDSLPNNHVREVEVGDSLPSTDRAVEVGDSLPNDYLREVEVGDLLPTDRAVLVGDSLPNDHVREVVESEDEEMSFLESLAGELLESTSLEALPSIEDDLIYVSDDRIQCNSELVDYHTLDIESKLMSTILTNDVNDKDNFFREFEFGTSTPYSASREEHSFRLDDYTFELESLNSVMFMESKTASDCKGTERPVPVFDDKEIAWLSSILV